MAEITLILRQPWMTRRGFDRLHWAARGRYMKLVAAESLAWCGILGFSGCFERCEIVAVRWHWRRLDHDNLVAGLKPIIDSLVQPTSRNPWGIGLIEDDRPEILRDLQALQIKCKQSEADLFRSEITITGRYRPARLPGS